MIAVQAKNPHEAFQEYKKNLRTSRNSPAIDELPPERKAWLRA